MRAPRSAEDSHPLKSSVHTLYKRLVTCVGGAGRTGSGAVCLLVWLLPLSLLPPPRLEVLLPGISGGKLVPPPLEPAMYFPATSSCSRAELVKFFASPALGVGGTYGPQCDEALTLIMLPKLGKGRDGVLTVLFSTVNRQCSSTRAICNIVCSTPKPHGGSRNQKPPLRNTESSCISR